MVQKDFPQAQRNTIQVAYNIFRDTQMVIDLFREAYTEAEPSSRDVNQWSSALINKYFDPFNYKRQEKVDTEEYKNMRTRTWDLRNIMKFMQA